MVDVLSEMPYGDEALEDKGRSLAYYKTHLERIILYTLDYNLHKCAALFFRFSINIFLTKQLNQEEGINNNNNEKEKK